MVAPVLFDGGVGATADDSPPTASVPAETDGDCSSSPSARKSRITSSRTSAAAFGMSPNFSGAADDDSVVFSASPAHTARKGERADAQRALRQIWRDRVTIGGCGRGARCGAHTCGLDPHVVHATADAHAIPVSPLVVQRADTTRCRRASLDDRSALLFRRELRLLLLIFSLTLRHL